MELKVKFLKWSAGTPVAMLNKKTAYQIGVHTKGRVVIRTLSRYSKEIYAITDIVENKIINKDEIIVSSESG